MLKILILLFISLIAISCAAYAIQLTDKDNMNVSILKGYKRQKIDFSASTEIEIFKTDAVQIPEINDKSKQLLNNFNKDISEKGNTKNIYDKVLNREVTRITSENAEIDLDKNAEIDLDKNAEIDLDKNGNLVNYKNLNDFSTIDENKKIIKKMKL